MSGATIEVTGSAAVQRRLAELVARIGSAAPLLETLGGAVESQTRRRLGHDKEGPDGQPWPDWSPAYAATRHGGQHLLESTGTLIDSVHYMVQGTDRVAVGSGMVYAAIHQFGGAEAGQPHLPARPWLGVGHDDEAEIEEVLGDWLKDLGLEGGG